MDPADYIRRILNDTYEGLNLILLPTSSSYFERAREIEFAEVYESDSVGNGSFKMSRALGFQSEGHICSWKMPGEWSSYKFVYSFEPIVWYSVIATLIAFAIIKTMEDRKGFRQLSEELWGIFSNPFGNKEFKIENSVIKNMTNILWLFCMTVLMSAFSGVLLRFFMEGIPYVVIDNWDELYNRKDIKIIALQFSFIKFYIDSFKDSDPKAQDFENRYFFFEDLGDILEKHTGYLTDEELVIIRSYNHSFENELNEFF